MSITLQMLEQHALAFLMYPFLLNFISMFLAFLIIKWLFESPKNQKLRPPSPRKLPILGNSHQIGTLVHQSLQTLAQKHGPIMSLQLGRISTIVISSSEAAREIMKNHDLTFADRPTLETAKKLLYDTKDVSVAPYGEFWRQLNSIYVLQLLSNKKIESFRRVRVDEAALMTTKIRESSSLSLPINLSKMFISLTNDVISRAAFGRKYGGGGNGQKFKQLLAEFLRLLGFSDVGHLFPWLRWINRVNGFNSQVERIARDIDEFLEGVLEERSNVLKNNNNDVDEIAEDFLDIMLRIYKDDSTGVLIDRDSIKAVILTTFAAGTDTTSYLFRKTNGELLRHPQVMKKVQNEVRQVMHGKQKLNFKLLPFGAGRRGCPGISFATAVNELVIANLVQKFDWELPGGIKEEELDMSECPGVVVHRKVPLVAIAKPI